MRRSTGKRLGLSPARFDAVRPALRPVRRTLPALGHRVRRAVAGRCAVAAALAVARGALTDLVLWQGLGCGGSVQGNEGGEDDPDHGPSSDPLDCPAATALGPESRRASREAPAIQGLNPPQGQGQ
jgi:hypothetical protein